MRLDQPAREWQAQALAALDRMGDKSAANLLNSLDKNLTKSLLMNIEERNPEYVTKIWEGNLPLPAGLSAGHPICVTFAYDINGTMNVSFKEGECGARGGKEITVDLRPGH